MMMRLWRWLSENSSAARSAGPRSAWAWDRWTTSPEQDDPSLYDDLYGPYSLGIYDGIDWVEQVEDEEEVA